jgi:flagellar hook-basal body protein
MMKALFSGVSGLKNHQFNMDVIGNNIANINTMGFKAGRMTFQEVMAHTMKGAERPGDSFGGINPVQIGLGMTMGAVDTIFSQGTLESTGIVTDLAIEGDAFFILSDGASSYYCRTGNFIFDAKGNLVDPSSGMIIQGTLADSDGVLAPASDVGNIQLPFGSKDPAKVTSEIVYEGNLDASKSPVGTILDSQRILAQAEGEDEIFGLYDTNGIGLGLLENDRITFSAYASTETKIANLYNDQGTALGFETGDTIVVSWNETTYDSEGIEVPLQDESFVGGKMTINGIDVTINTVNDWEDADDIVQSIVEDINSTEDKTFVAEVTGTTTFVIKCVDRTTDLDMVELDDDLFVRLGLSQTETEINVEHQSDEITIGTGGEFPAATVAELVSQIDVILTAGAAGYGDDDLKVELNADDGTIGIENNGTYDFDLQIISGSPHNGAFDNMLLDLQGDLLAGESTDPSESFKVYDDMYANVDFETLDELAEQLEDAMQKVSSAATVTFTGGTFRYDNSLSQTTGIAGATISTSPAQRSILIDAMGLQDTDIDAQNYENSSIILDIADGEDRLEYLYGVTGERMGLDTMDSVTIQGKVGGEAIVPQTETVGVTMSTLQDLADAIEEAFGIENTTGVTIDTNDGSISVQGDPGGDNALTEVTIEEEGNSVFSSSMTFNESQSAKDVTHAASALVYDSLGDTHTVSITFKKSNVPNYWTWEVSMGGDETILSGGSGIILFNADGTLESFSADDGDDLTFEPGNGADVLSIDLNAGTVDGLDGITQFASASTVLVNSQDGWGNGDLDSIYIDSTGVITGLFTNSVTKNLGQIYLAEFNNPSGLLKMGDNLYQKSGNSGDPIVGIASEAINSRVHSGAIEMSNVELANEFTNMIITQRGFQANARIITAGDEMLTETVNLKR